VVETAGDVTDVTDVIEAIDAGRLFHGASIVAHWDMVYYSAIQ
jgi:hypothetical protein